MDAAVYLLLLFYFQNRYLVVSEVTMHHPSRGGVRGGQDQFSWDDVKMDKHRENYLGKKDTFGIAMATVSFVRFESALILTVGSPSIYRRVNAGSG